MASRAIKSERSLVDALVAEYHSKRSLIEQFRNQLVGALRDSPEMTPFVHSLKSRLKEPEHLRDKLFRKLAEDKKAKRPFEITTDNLLRRATDLVGVRILHLHTRQIRGIDRALRSILNEQQFALLEGPFARTWDDESRQFMRECGIETQDSPSMYTSVHYVVSSASRTKITAEIQVRTLMEEVWGEVDHAIKYPDKTPSLACQEQLKVLARATSTATRLVDAIFLTMDDDERSKQASGRNVGANPRKRRVSRKKAPVAQEGSGSRHRRGR